jgi:hypothetical protein
VKTLEEASASFFCEKNSRQHEARFERKLQNESVFK